MSLYIKSQLYFGTQSASHNPSIIGRQKALVIYSPLKDTQYRSLTIFSLQFIGRILTYLEKVIIRNEKVKSVSYEDNNSQFVSTIRPENSTRFLKTLLRSLCVLYRDVQIVLYLPSLRMVCGYYRVNLMGTRSQRNNCNLQESGMHVSRHLSEIPATTTNYFVIYRCDILGPNYRLKIIFLLLMLTLIQWLTRSL